MVNKGITGLRVIAVVTILGMIPTAAMAQSGMAAGAKIFIEPHVSGEFHVVWGPQKSEDEENGAFAIYLTAAIREKHVNVVVTTDKSKADYILETTSDHIKKVPALKNSIISDWTAPVLPQRVNSYDSASVRLINAKTSDVVFAYSVDRNNTAHGRQTAAESCAKHLKDAVATGLNPKGSQGATTADKMAAWPWRANPAMGFGIY